MKIAIFFRGPFKTGIENGEHNILKLINNFKGLDIETFLFSWKDDNSKAFVNKEYIDNFFLMKEFESRLIESFFNGKTENNKKYADIWKSYNSYKMFWQMKYIISLIHSLNKFDLICFQRVDKSFEIDKSIIDMAINNDKYYIFEGCRNCNEMINDQFGIAKTEIMKRAWNFLDDKSLNDIYNDSINPENCLFKLIKGNNVPYEKIYK